MARQNRRRRAWLHRRHLRCCRRRQSRVFAKRAPGYDRENRFFQEDFDELRKAGCRIADDWTQDVDHGGAWPVKIVATKYRVAEAVRRVVDTALDLAGGSGIFAASGIERLFRDVRLARIHPANSALSHELVAELTLGIDPDAQPRWG